MATLPEGPETMKLLRGQMATNETEEIPERFLKLACEQPGACDDIFEISILTLVNAYATAELKAELEHRAAGN